MIQQRFAATIPATIVTTIVTTIATLVLAGCASTVSNDAPALWHVKNDADSRLWIIASIDDLPASLQPSRLNARSINRAFPEASKSGRQPAVGRLRKPQPPLTWFSHRIRGAFTRADIVMVADPVEISIGELTDLAAKTDRLESCRPIEEYLDAREKTAYGSVFADLKRPYSPPPESASSALFVLAMMEFSRAQWSTDVGVDDWFVAQAKREGKTVIALESIRDRRDAIARVLKTGSCRDQAEAVRAFLDLSQNTEDKGKKLYESSVEHWHTGHVNGFRTDLESEAARSELLFEALITQRNRLWAARIQEQLQGGKSVLAVVGSAHLERQDSLPALFEQSGYQVRRVQ